MRTSLHLRRAASVALVVLAAAGGFASSRVLADNLPPAPTTTTQPQTTVTVPQSTAPAPDPAPPPPAPKKKPSPKKPPAPKKPAEARQPKPVTQASAPPAPVRSTTPPAPAAAALPPPVIHPSPPAVAVVVPKTRQHPRAKTRTPINAKNTARPKHRPVTQKPVPARPRVTTASRSTASKPASGESMSTLLTVFGGALLVVLICSLGIVGIRRGLAAQAEPAKGDGQLTAPAPAEPFTVALVNENHSTDQHVVEPLAGGAALAAWPETPVEGSVDTCEVVRWRGYTRSAFHAAAVDGDGLAYDVARSPLFKWRKSDEPPQEATTIAARQELVEKLIADGWEQVARGQTWYGGVFRRRRELNQLECQPEPDVGQSVTTPNSGTTPLPQSVATSDTMP
jgi:periplasmic protein TonB